LEGSVNKTIFIKAHFKPRHKEITVEVPTGKTTTGFFGGKKEVTRKETRREQIGWSNCEIDGERLATDISQAISELNNAGYDVISITNITSGDYNYDYKAPQYGSYGYGYGYSYTEGVLILSRQLK